jgi:hypothetical protein
MSQSLEGDVALCRSQGQRQRRCNGCWPLRQGETMWGEKSVEGSEAFSLYCGDGGNRESDLPQVVCFI